jgi:hypothetical protein
MVSAGMATSKMYAIATNKFLIRISGLNLEITFTKDNSGKIDKVYISKDGEMLMTANKSN